MAQLEACAGTCARILGPGGAAAAGAGPDCAEIGPGLEAGGRRGLGRAPGAPALLRRGTSLARPAAPRGGTSWSPRRITAGRPGQAHWYRPTPCGCTSRVAGPQNHRHTPPPRRFDSECKLDSRLNVHEEGCFGSGRRRAGPG
jgi:hypothetical protein